MSSLNLEGHEASTVSLSVGDPHITCIRAASGTRTEHSILRIHGALLSHPASPNIIEGVMGLCSVPV